MTRSPQDRNKQRCNGKTVHVLPRGEAGASKARAVTGNIAKCSKAQARNQRDAKRREHVDRTRPQRSRRPETKHPRRHLHIAKEEDKIKNYVRKRSIQSKSRNCCGSPVRSNERRDNKMKSCPTVVRRQKSETAFHMNRDKNTSNRLDRREQVKPRADQDVD